ncbi:MULTISPECIES: hypothetical protein [Chelativorans]|jgi:hypothetical protein|uniref:Uncharacterized protein n=1 Tax=Chelativorans sp. (strain BNC1) TaxID=266779 RepID=Q11ET1_CHESB|nr:MULTISPECIES: hypothetical protein [Chelativorans]
MNENRGSIIAAALILIGFGIVAFLMPRIMLWVANFSAAAAGVVAAVFVAAFFLVFWLRARSQRRKEK